MVVARFRGEFEERLKAIMDEIRSAGNIILMIDEVHTLIGTGGVGGYGCRQHTQACPGAGELQCVGATTLDES